jgi:hypothetical protein
MNGGHCAVVRMTENVNYVSSPQLQLAEFLLKILVHKF